MTYFKDIDCNGKTIYFRNNGRRFIKASVRQAELEISMGADVEDYFPWKPEAEMTDRQLLAACRSSLKHSGKLYTQHTDELNKRGLTI
jgi:hypothetical protein